MEDALDVFVQARFGPTCLNILEEEHPELLSAAAERALRERVEASGEGEARAHLEAHLGLLRRCRHAGVLAVANTLHEQSAAAAASAALEANPEDGEALEEALRAWESLLDREDLRADPELHLRCVEEVAGLRLRRFRERRQRDDLDGLIERLAPLARSAPGGTRPRHRCQILLGFAYTARYELLHEQADLDAASATYRGLVEHGAGSSEALRSSVLELGKAVLSNVKAAGEVRLDAMISALDRGMLAAYEQGNADLAAVMGARSLDLAGQRFGEESLEYAQHLCNLGAVLDARDGGDAGARAMLEKALDVLGRGEHTRDPVCLATLQNLGILCMRMGDLAAAERYLVLAAGGSFDEPPPDGRLKALDNLALLLDRLGREDEAVALRRESTAGWRRLVEEMEGVFEVVGDVRRPLPPGVAAGEPGPQERERLAARAQALLASYREGLATSLSALGEQRRALGDPSQAVRIAKEVIDLRRTTVGEEHPSFAMALNNLGLALHGAGELEAARSPLSRSLDIRTRALPAGHPDIAIAQNALAELERDSGHLDEALALQRAALETRRARRGERHTEYAASLNNLGLVHQARGDLAAAVQAFREALDVTRAAVGPDHPRCATTLLNLGLALLASGDREAALDALDASWGVHEGRVALVARFGSERTLEATRALARPSEMAFLAAVHAADTPPRFVARALERVFRRKGLGAEVIAMRRRAALGGGRPDLAPLIQEIDTLGKRFAEAPAADLAARIDELETSLAEKLPEVRLDRELHGATVEAVAAALPGGSALIEVIHFRPLRLRAPFERGQAVFDPARYLAFVLPAGAPGDVRAVDLGDASAIDGAISALREAILGARPGREVRRPKAPEGARAAESEIGEALRARLLDPLSAALGGRTRLFIAPDGDLWRLPFEVLPLPGGRRAVDLYTISYLTVGRDALRAGRQLGGTSSRALVVADPDFDLAGEGEGATRGTPEPTAALARLPGTREEGIAVARMLGVEPLLGERARKSAVQGARSPHVLHVATHGYFTPGPATPSAFAGLVTPGDRPDPLMRSGLALAGANRRPDGTAATETFLTARDVACLDLLGTSLVVLSACDTGLGDVDFGEGVLGLRRAVAVAGAGTLVLSLWRVPDAETTELMCELYRRVLAGLPRAEALREAQLVIKARHPEPLCWAAFTCQGDWTPLVPPAAGPARTA